MGCLQSACKNSTQHPRSCQLVHWASACNNDMLLHTRAWLYTKLRNRRLYILYSQGQTINPFLVTTALKRPALLIQHVYVEVTCIYLCCKSKITFVLLQALPRSGNRWFALCNDCLTKQVFVSDRSIYYANYALKSWRDAMPILERAVITSTRTVFAGASNKHSKQMLSSNWFKLWCIYSQGENVCLVWRINLGTKRPAFSKASWHIETNWATFNIAL